MYGNVNADLEATLLLHIAGPHGQPQEVTAIIDTGYNGALALPLAMVTALVLAPSASRMVTLGDASQRVFDFDTAHVHWEGEVQRIRVLCVAGSPLVGTALLQRHKLEAEFTPGGVVMLTPLSYSPLNFPMRIEKKAMGPPTHEKSPVKRQNISQSYGVRS